MLCSAHIHQHTACWRAVASAGDLSDEPAREHKVESPKSVRLPEPLLFRALQVAQVHAGRVRGAAPAREARRQRAGVLEA